MRSYLGFAVSPGLSQGYFIIMSQDTVNVNPNMIQEIDCDASNPKEKPIWDFLAAMRDESAFRRLVILGAPGLGKTTLLRYIALI